MTIQNRLFELKDEKYALFQAKLMPTVPKDSIIGVRVPQVRRLAKDFFKEKEHFEFLQTLPHQYYDENMLHGLLLCEIKDYEACIFELDRFLPFVDNWTVCDILSPKVLKKNKAKLIQKIPEWTKSEKPFICRFGLEMLMSHFLDDDFDPKHFEIALNVQNADYYVKMMIAWFFATALAKQWDFAIKVLENSTLETWTHNKTIQKACESYRIASEKKAILRNLKK